METTGLPIPLARAVMRVMPAPLLARSIEIVMRRMRGRFPNLFKNLGALPCAVVYLDPTDLPHSFVLQLGQTPATFEIANRHMPRPAEATSISGSLESLVDMLEGRADGDMLFFSRDIQVTGDTSVIVALRNTLDRQEIDLFAEITGMCGPFAAPARVALTMADRLAQRVRAHVESVRDNLHDKATGP